MFEKIISEANKILPQAFADAHGVLVKGAAQFEPCAFDERGARRALHYLDRVRPHAVNHAQNLARIRAELVAAIVANGGNTTAHHDDAARHELEELCARSARAIRTRVDTVHCTAPNAYASRVVNGVTRTASGHEAFDDSNHDPSHVIDWLSHLAAEEDKRGDMSRAIAWRRNIAEIRNALEACAAATPEPEAAPKRRKSA